MTDRKYNGRTLDEIEALGASTTTMALVERVRELEAEWRTKYLRLAKRHIKLRFESKRLRGEVRELEARLERVREFDPLFKVMKMWGAVPTDWRHFHEDYVCAILDTPAKEGQ